MENRLYREELLEIFRNPPNRGKIAKPDLEAKLTNPLCGDEVCLQIKLGKNQTIEKAVFSGNGCAISQVSASLLASNIEGKQTSEVKRLDVRDIIKLIGIAPSLARLKCATLSLEVLRKAIKSGGLI